MLILPYKYQEIFGWMDFEDVYRQIYQHMPSDGLFLEIGAFYGRSTCYMAELLDYNPKKFTFVTIDTFAGTSNETEDIHKEIIKEKGNLYQQYKSNIKPFKKHITTIKGLSTSPSTLAQLQTLNKPIDAIFFDGDHSYEGLKSDITTYMPLLSTSAIIAGHDYNSFESVKQIVDEIFTNKKISKNSWYTIKQ